MGFVQRGGWASERKEEGEWGQGIYSPRSLSEKLPEAKQSLSVRQPSSQRHSLPTFSPSSGPATTGLGLGTAPPLTLAWAQSLVVHLCSPKNTVNKPFSSNVPSVFCWDSGTDRGNEQSYEFCERCFGEQGEPWTNHSVSTAYQFSLGGLQC